MAGIKIPISIDNANFTAAAQQAQNAVKSVSGEVRGLEKDTQNATDSMKEMIKQAAAFGGLSIGLAGAKEFISNIVDVRREMQGYQTSLEVLLKDQGKANAMFNELKDFAVTTPLMFKDLAAGAQTMLGFNIEAEKVVPTLKAIGDISMGDAGRFQSLTLAFSQMSATGKLMGQDLLQMINAGFNPLMEISRKTGKSISELKDEMSAGSISATMVADAFMSATQEGGQFYGMLEKQGQTLAGKLNTLNGAIDDMFNNLGEKSEGVINAAVEGATDLIKNYEKVGQAVMDLTVAYGSYKAAIATVSAIQGVKNTASISEMQAEIEAYRAKNTVQVDSTAETIKEAAAKANLDAVTTAKVETMYAEIQAQDELYASQLKAQVASGSMTAAQEQELLSMRASSSEKLLMSTIDKEAAAQALATANSRMEAAQKVVLGLDEEFEMYEKLMNENEMLGNSELANFYSEKLQVTVQQQKAASTELAAAAKAKETAQENFNTVATNANTAATQRQNLAQIASIKSMGLMQAAGIQLRNIMLSLNAAIDANPLVILAAAVAAAGFAIYKGMDYMGAFSEKLMDAQDISEKLTESQNKLKEAHEEQRKEVERLLGVLHDESSTEGERILAYNELKEKCASLTNQYSIEELAVLNLAKAYKVLKQEQEAQSTQQMIDDTNRMIRVLNDLNRVKRGMQKNGSAETQEFLKEQGLSGQSVDQITKALKAQIEKNKAIVTPLIDQAKKNKDKSQIPYKEMAELIKGDWNEAKRALEVLLKTQGATKEQIDKAKAQVEAYAQEYKSWTGEEIDKKSSKNSNNAAKQALEDQQKLSDLRKEYAKQAQREAEDLENNTIQAQINAMSEGADRVLAQLDLNYKKELQEIKREKEDLLAAREESARKQWEAENAKSIREGKISWDTSEYKKQFESTNKLTPEDTKYFEEREKVATKAFEKGVADRHAIDEQSRRDYLKAYGTLEQKKAAMTEEYTEKIRKAQEEGNEWLAKDLQQQLANALNDMDMDAFKLDINWEAVFGDLSKYTKSQLKTIKSQLENYKLSDNYVKGTEENKKVIDEAINNVQQNIIDSSGIFGGLGYALQELATAQRELAAAEIELENATTDTEKEAAKKKKNKAQQKVDNAEADLESASENTVNYIQNMANTITNLGTASELSLSDLGSLASTIAGAFGDAGKKAGGWIAAIFDICEMVAKDGLVGLLKNVSGLLVEVVGGLFGVDFYEGEREYQKQKKLNDNYISLLDEIITEQQKLMERQGALEAQNTATLIKEDYEEIKKRQQQNLYNWFGAGASGTSHSNGYNAYQDLFSKINWFSNDWDNFDSPAWDDVKYYMKVFGYDNWMQIDQRLSEIGTASLDQLKQLKSNTEFFASLPDEVQEYINKIIEADEAIGEMNEQLIETSTAVSFDSLHDSFVDSIMDMDKTAEEFAEDFSKYMMKAATESFVKDEIDAQLKAWQEDWQKRMADEDGLTEADINALREEYNRIIAQGEAKREELAKITGYGDTGSTANIDSFDNVKSAFMDLVSDMDSTAQDFSDKFSELMYSALVNNQLNDTYKGQIEDWYKSYKEAVSSGNLNEDTIAKLKSDYNSLVESMQKDAKELAELAGKTIVTTNPVEFDDVKSSFLSLISDMDSTSQDFADTFVSHFNEAMLQMRIEESIKGDLEEWYKEFSAMVESGAMLSQEEVDNLRARYVELGENAKETAQVILQVTGEWEKTMKEKVVGVSFDSMKENFKKAMMDMKKTSEDFSKDLKQTIYEAMSEKMFDDTYSTQLEVLYNSLYEALSNGKDEAGRTVDEILAKIEELYKESNDASMKIAKDLGANMNDLKSAITGIDFTELTNGFSSVIGDMTLTAEDFADDFSKMMFNAIMKAQLANVWEAQLQEVYNDMYDWFSKPVEERSQEDYDAIKQNYIGIMTEIQNFGTQVENTIGYQTSAQKSAAEEAAEEARQAAEEAAEKARQEWEERFESIKSSFTSTLSSMDRDVDAFKKGLQKVTMEKLVDKVYEEKFNAQLESWYNKYESWINKGGDATSNEFKQLMAEYEDLGDKAAETYDALVNALGIESLDNYEKTTNKTFDNIKSSFSSLLSDMSNDAQDFSTNFTTMLQEALMNAQMQDLLDDELKTWYKQFGEVMNDGQLTDTEIADLRAAYNNIVEDALDRREAIAKITGYDKLSATSQSGGSSAFSGMSQETAGELNGRFTALQVAGESMAASMIEYLTQMRSLCEVSIEQNQAVQEIRNMMVHTNSYLEDIVKYAKQCNETLSQKLGTISSNTKNL